MGIIVILMLIFAIVEFGRMVMVYTTIANAARIGARYAITNSTPPDGTTATYTSIGTIQSNVTAVVKSFLAPMTVNINAAGLTITTTFPDEGTCTPASLSCSGTTAGNRVQVTVSYPYDLITSYLPMKNLTLSSTSEGIITW